MDFDFEAEEQKLLMANEGIKKVMSDYDEILDNLSDKDKGVLQLYFYLKKLDTIKEMTPKGNYWDGKREAYINEGIRMIEEYGKKIFPDINNIEELRSDVYNYMNESELPTIINGFSNDVKSAYKHNCEHVYTILPISGLKELKASMHRENQYLNSITNGVFATGAMREVENYIGRANVDGMIVRGNKIRYPRNPFSEVTEDGLKLIKPVSVYLSDIDLFEPQFDFEIDKDGKPHFLFGDEWVAPYEKIGCVEKQVAYLPTSFIEKNDVSYNENGEDKPIKLPHKTF